MTLTTHADIHEKENQYVLLLTLHTKKKKNGTEEWSGRSTTETDVTSFKRHKISADNYAKRVAFLEAKFRGEVYPDQNNAIDTGYRNLSSAAIPLSIRSTSRITRTKLHNLGIILETPE